LVLQVLSPGYTSATHGALSHRARLLQITTIVPEEVEGRRTTTTWDGQ